VLIGQSSSVVHSGVMHKPLIWQVIPPSHGLSESSHATQKL
jgi:hypothetical protein